VTDTIELVRDTTTITTIKQAERISGTLSKPGKMPGHAYNIPAECCHVGSKLRKVAGSVCSGCYAMKGRYLFRNVRDAMYYRKDRMENHPRWVDAMVFLIRARHKTVPYFRWFDSGDLQSVAMLRRIIEVCNRTPEIQHWLPTREKGIIVRFVREDGYIPTNLNIRVSAPLVDSTVGIFKIQDCTVSTVSTDDKVHPEAHHCPSRFQDGKCVECRACWSRNVAWVDYHKH